MKRKFVKWEDLTAAEISAIHEERDRSQAKISLPVLIDPELTDDFLPISPNSTFITAEDVVDETAACFCNCGEDRDSEGADAVDIVDESPEVDINVPSSNQSLVTPDIIRCYELQGDRQILVAASITTEDCSVIPCGKTVDTEVIITRDEAGSDLTILDDEVPVKPPRKSKKIIKEKKTKRRDNLKTQPQKKHKRRKRQFVACLKNKWEGQPRKLYLKLQQAAACFPFMV